MDQSELRSLFPGLSGVIYMNTASLNIGSLPVRQAYELGLEQWMKGAFDWTEAERAADDARCLFATIIGAQPGEVALVPFVSAAAGVVATQLPPAHRGENVLVADIEFSSNFYPWMLLREKGYDVRVVATVEGMTLPERYATLADGGTRLIAASAVQSATGYRVDLAELSTIARRSAAWFFVDASQAAGAVDVDVRRHGIDFLATPSHKFLLGTRGMGYLFVRSGLFEELRPILTGWRAARFPLQSFFGPDMELSVTASKFDTSQVWFAALAEPQALGILHRFGLSQVYERNQQLITHLYEALTRRQLLKSPFPNANRSTIVSFPIDNPDAAMARLKAAGVVVSLRAGRVRLSLHVYNTEDEIDRVMTLLAAM